LFGTYNQQVKNTKKVVIDGGVYGMNYVGINCYDLI